MDRLRNYSQGRIESLMAIDQKIFSRVDFVELRNLLCSRLTLFNGRRGGEPARVKQSQWLDRAKWLAKGDIESLDDEEKLLHKSLELFYLSGKGNHLVSCIIPSDSMNSRNGQVVFKLSSQTCWYQFR